MSPPSNEIFPCPVFEGSEKRISISFSPLSGAPAPPAAGLRALTRTQLDAMLELAACEIVSVRNGVSFDAYVLSESSLFVYPDRMVLKTCGTTRLLEAVPRITGLAAGLNLAPSRVKYSRASFLFPEKQPEPHHGFEHECNVLHEQFASLGSSSAYVLGDALNGLQWHVYVAGTHSASARTHPAAARAPRHTLEVCMTGLAPHKAAKFFRTSEFVSSQETTITSGIANLAPAHAIDDYVFEPCGYSMNGMSGIEYSTIHITPEDGFSYASFELCGYDPAVHCPAELVARCVSVFAPSSVSVALSADTLVPGPASPGWGDSFQAPLGYAFHSSSYQEVSCGGYVAYFTLEAGTEAQQQPAVPMIATTADVHNKGVVDGGSSGSECSSSPRGVLKHLPSFKTLPAPASVTADIDLMAGSDNSSDCGVDASGRGAMEAQMPATVEEVAALHAAVPLLHGDATTIDAHIRDLIDRHSLEDNLYVIDLGAVDRLYRAWGEAMPRVHAHYAVKCNNDPALLSSLAALGAGFDCASEAEVEQVTAMGVSPDRIIFANPCKRPADIRFAAAKGVTYSTYDTEAELLKLRRWAPGSRVLLRIRADDPTARCPLGNKFGAEEWEWEELLAAARRHGVPVDGISFHVGSGATNPAAFSYAIELARRAFDLGAAYGFQMSILDIGGGFCGGRFFSDGRVDLGGVPAAVNSSLARHFPEGCGVRVIAEPGRYFAESVATLACLVYGRRQRCSEPGATPSFDYWITDGLYGSMNCLLYDHATVYPRPLGDPNSSAAKVAPSTVFGPTCDGLDTVVRDYPLPELQVGDWLLFRRMGAYTLCGASKFNGVNAVDVPTFYVASAAP
ncbi:hypothetical protein Ndes2526B_g07541 [Nannochloris sp. 'desiccata']|nr:hypothetical protein KSW81_001206 [Chlorella desiccata (nom. nud.)]KAH7617677.1 putative Ornithine decarboxylase [Chlorella desiccata (nom. nud.)]